METPAKDRQRKWKDKQASEGKKAVNVMLSAEIKEMIDKEKVETGETIGKIIERAIRNLLAHGNRRKIEINPNDLTKKQKGTMAMVRTMHAKSRLPNSRIASFNNKTNRETISDISKWDKEEVQAILDYIDEHDLRYRLF
jgi:CO dehydrogenase/acetyl-CoA synthase epsilon subunit